MTISRMVSFVGWIGVRMDFVPLVLKIYWINAIDCKRHWNDTAGTIGNQRRVSGGIQLFVLAALIKPWRNND